MSSFEFLAQDSPDLYRLALDAEDRFRNGDTIGCVAALRTFGEEAAKVLLDCFGMNRQPGYDGHASQSQRIEDLYDRGRISTMAYHGLQVLRSIGNETVHEWRVSTDDALRCLEKAYEVAIVQHGNFAPRARLTPANMKNYAPPTFGDVKMQVENLMLENSELKSQLEEVRQLIQEQPDDGNASLADASEVQSLTSREQGITPEDQARLWRVARLCEVKRELECLRKASSDSRRLRTPQPPGLSQDFNRIRADIRRLVAELSESFIAEGDLARLIARRHRATQVRQQIETDGRAWPVAWDDELARIEKRIDAIRFHTQLARQHVAVEDPEEQVHLQILDCYRRKALAEALRREFRDRQMPWPVPWNQTERKLDRRLDDLFRTQLTLESQQMEGVM